MSDDIKGLSDQFGNLEKSFVEFRTEQHAMTKSLVGVRAEQHEMAKSLVGVGHRIDIMEVQVQAAQARETLVVKAVNDKLDNSNAMIKKLFDKFDDRDKQEKEDRKERNEKELEERDKVVADNKQQKNWIIVTCVSALISIGLLWIGKWIGG